MWFVRWDLIYHKSVPSNTRFFPFIFATENYFHFWVHIIFIAACTIFVFMNYFTIFYELLLNQLINLTSFLLCFSLNVFPHSLKISHMHFISKNIPAKRNETFIWINNVPPKRDPGFMKVGSLLGGRIYFHRNRSWFFNRILL